MSENDKPIEACTAQIERAFADRALRPEVRAFFDEETNTVSYVVYDLATKCAAVIDPVLDFEASSGRTSTTSADEILEFVQEEALDVEYLLETHAHADHLSAAPYLQEKLGGKLGIGEHIATVQEVFGNVFNAGTEFRRDGSDFDLLFADGDSFELGKLPVTVLHVPGHTPACVAFVIGDAAFVGDTMFMPDYGTARADFPGGDARQLFRSLRRILTLPEQTRLFMCHDYLPKGRNHYTWETTVAAEREGNIHANDQVSEDEFVAMREARDATLNMPQLILPAIQVNIRAGHLPEPEENGVRYLKIPLDAV